MYGSPSVISFIHSSRKNPVSPADLRMGFLWIIGPPLAQLSMLVLAGFCGSDMAIQLYFFVAVVRAISKKSHGFGRHPIIFHGGILLLKSWSGL